MPASRTPTHAQPDLIGAMYTDGHRLWEIVAADGTQNGQPAWLVADAHDDPLLASRDRQTRRMLQRELDQWTRVGFGGDVT